MRRQSRIDQLQEIIAHAYSITVKELAEQLGVSGMTIRRDMEILREAGVVRIYRGGVIVSEKNNRSSGSSRYSLTTAETSRVEEKRAIAKTAATLVEEGDVVFFDAGSTVELILDYLNPDLEMTVICYSLNILKIIAGWKNIRIVFAGGVFHSNSQNFDSPEGLQLLGRNRCSKAFISANGIRVGLGVTSSNQFEIPIKRVVIENSAHSYLLTDSSKFGLVQTAYFADIDVFSAIITDWKIDGTMHDEMTEHDATIIIAPPIMMNGAN